MWISGPVAPCLRPTGVASPVGRAGASGACVTGTKARGAKASARIDGDAVLITLDGFTSDSRKRRPTIEAAVTFTAASGPVTGPAEVTFDFALTVGIGPEFSPLVGGVRGSMAGTCTASGM